MFPRRYERQIIIPGFGEKAQEKLSRASVVILGLGGLGSVVSTYLTAAGIGYIRLIDRDMVEESNLNRQILYDEKDIGRWKAKIAEKKLKSMNSGIEIEGLSEEINDSNIYDLIGDVDLVVDCLDNFETRFIVNKAIVDLDKPMIHGACRGFSGQVTTIIPRKTPCLRCIFRGNIYGKDKSIIGTTAGVIGLIEATEAIKYVTKIGNLLAGTMLVYDARDLVFEKIEIERDPECEVCG